MFKFSPQTSLRYILRTEIIMSSLLKAIVAVDNMEIYWPWMLAFCLYAQFLLVLLPSNCNPTIVHILDQVEASQNPFPLILAETIIGLNKFTEIGRFFGSPMLVEVRSFHYFILFMLYRHCSFFYICIGMVS